MALQDLMIVHCLSDRLTTTSPVYTSTRSMCLNDTRSSASASSYSYDVKDAKKSAPKYSPSLVDAFRHASMTTSVRGTVVVVEGL